MTIFIISIIAVIVIYCLAIISRTTNTIPTPPTTPITEPTTEPTKPTPHTKPTSHTDNEENLLGPCVEEVWSLTEFAKKFDRMKVGDCPNHTTGEVFKTCIFFKDNTLTFVYFYKTLGVLTKEEISKREGELKVGRTSNNKYYLYVGKDNIADDVDLGIK